MGGIGQAMLRKRKGNHRKLSVSPLTFISGEQIQNILIHEFIDHHDQEASLLQETKARRLYCQFVYMKKGIIQGVVKLPIVFSHLRVRKKVQNYLQAKYASFLKSNQIREYLLYRRGFPPPLVKTFFQRKKCNTSLKFWFSLACLGDSVGLASNS